MFLKKRKSVVAVCLFMLEFMIAFGQTMSPVTPKDCATVRYFRTGDLYPTMSLNNAGSKVAYLVKTPDLIQNRDLVELYVKDVSSSTGGRQLLLSAADITHPTWMADGRHIVALVKDGTRRTIVEVDSLTGAHTNLTRSDFDIREFSISIDGNVLVFATEVLQPSTPAPTPGYIATGYRINFLQPTETPVYYSPILDRQ